MFDEIKVAGYLAYKTISRGRKATNALMIFIMSLAFINLVFISSILNGVVAAIDRQLRTNFVSNIVIEPQESPVQKDYIIRVRELRDRIGQLAGVVGTSARYKMPGIVAFDRRKDGTFKRRSTTIIGVDPENERNFSEVADKMIRGRYLEGLGSGDIILGLDLSGGPGASTTVDNLGGADVGDKVEIAFGNGVSREYTVRGIFRTDFPFVDMLAFVTQREAESILGTYDDASQVLVKLDQPGGEDRVIAEIRRFAPNLKIRSWTEYLGFFSSVSGTVGTITAVVSGIGLAVAAVTIFIVIFVGVASKRRQIGILKAIGLNPRIIVYSYVLQALFYSVCGVIIGLAASLFVLVPYFLAHPLLLPLGPITLVLERHRVETNVLMLLGAALVAGFLPSWQGARENILKAIWGD